MQKAALLHPPAEHNQRAFSSSPAPFVEPTLDEADSPAAPYLASRNTARDRAKAANKLLSALLPNSNRAERRTAMQRMQRAKNKAAK